MIVIAYVVAEICHHYIVSKTYANFTRNFLSKTGPRCMYSYKYTCGKHRGYLFFSVKDRHLFHRVDTIGDIFTSGAAEKKKPQILCLFHAFNPLRERLYQNPVQFFSVILRVVPLPHSNELQYYVKREKCKVNDVWL